LGKKGPQSKANPSLPARSRRLILHFMENFSMNASGHFVGIDVSRDKLDIAVLRGSRLLFHRVIRNLPSAIDLFIDEFLGFQGAEAGDCVFCLEQTGIYTSHLLNGLGTYGLPVVLEDAARIKNSMGLVRSKTDKLDAERIARYAYRNRDELRLYTPRRAPLQQLAHLSTMRTRLVMLQGALNTPLGEAQKFLPESIYEQNARICKASRLAITADIQKAQKSIRSIIKADKRLKRLMAIVTSIPGIGEVTAVHILVCTNEFLDISDPKKFASYAGIAPFVRESGKMKRRTAVSPRANKKIKSLLHVCAVIAKTHIPEFKAYYLRKTAEGKSRMSVINALRNKLVHRIFACVKQDRLYTPAKINSSPLELANKSSS